MNFTLSYPDGFDRKPAPARARQIAQTLARVEKPDLRLVALLEEMAVEIELGQRTELTSSHRDAPPPALRVF